LLSLRSKALLLIVLSPSLDCLPTQIKQRMFPTILAILRVFIFVYTGSAVFIHLGLRKLPEAFATHKGKQPSAEFVAAHLAALAIRSAQFAFAISPYRTTLISTIMHSFVSTTTAACV
jgi:hypothetical protein